jgi:hypothetical protein
MSPDIKPSGVHLWFKIGFPMKRAPVRALLPVGGAALLLVFASSLRATSDALSGTRFRVIVCSDIGGTDPDDFQSMVHLFLHADLFDLEGIVSSPYGAGRQKHILEVVEPYARDFPNLRTHSAGFPTPEYLRSIAKQGAIDGYGGQGFGAPTEGSNWIVQCARRADPRPLWVLVWGGIDDLAQALHDAPEIEPRLRVYFIGGPNKMWSVNAYNYIEQHHPRLWFIEANSTYRGWFNGGNQTGEWSNTGFVTAHLAGRGALGAYFATHLRGTIKMGDSPSLAYLLHGTPDDPTQPGWGGQFVRIWDGRMSRFDRLTTAADEVEAFGTVELALAVPANAPDDVATRLVVDNRINVAGTREGSVVRFRFSPRDAKLWPYVVRSAITELDGKAGAFTAVLPSPEKTRRASTVHPNWWTDDPSPAAREGVHAGAKHVSRWREDWLRDFAERANWAAAPKSESHP